MKSRLGALMAIALMATPEVFNTLRIEPEPEESEETKTRRQQKNEIALVKAEAKRNRKAAKRSKK